MKGIQPVAAAKGCQWIYSSLLRRTSAIHNKNRVLRSDLFSCCDLLKLRYGFCVLNAIPDCFPMNSHTYSFSICVNTLMPVVFTSVQAILFWEGTSIHVEILFWHHPVRELNLPCATDFSSFFPPFILFHRENQFKQTNNMKFMCVRVPLIFVHYIVLRCFSLKNTTLKNKVHLCVL